jgi:hypothetical protein
VIEREAKGNVAAAIVAGDGEAVVAERAHQADAVLSHRSLGVGLLALRHYRFR